MARNPILARSLVRWGQKAPGGQLSVKSVPADAVASYVQQAKNTIGGAKRVAIEGDVTSIDFGERTVVHYASGATHTVKKAGGLTGALAAAGPVVKAVGLAGIGAAAAVLGVGGVVSAVGAEGTAAAAQEAPPEAPPEAVAAVQQEAAGPPGFLAWVRSLFTGR